jgi:UDP-glucose 4-epimerase
MSTTILINGIDSLLGARIAQMLTPHDDLKLVGLGRTLPAAAVGRTETLIAPLDGQQMAELLRAEQIDVVIQLAMLGEEQPSYHRETAVQQNVLANMQLLGACAAAGVQRIVVRSSSLVYGAHSNHPAFIGEEQVRSRVSGTSLLNNYVELDHFATDFARKHPQLSITVLRCAGLVGGNLPSPFTRYLMRPMPPMLIGFNPLIQVLHPEDAAAAFARAATSSVSGAFNLAAEAPLTLAQAVRLAGRQPAPLASTFLQASALFGVKHTRPNEWPFKPDFLRYNCIVDTRRARQELGWQPLYRAEASLRELRAGCPDNNEHARAEYALRTFLERQKKV